MSCSPGCRRCHPRSRRYRYSAPINQRGFCVDRVLAEAARGIAQAAAPEIDAELAELTDGAVTSIHQVARLQGVAAGKRLYRKDAPTAKRSRRCSESSCQRTVRRVLELRQGGAKPPPKDWRLCLRAGVDGRIRGALRYSMALDWPLGRRRVPAAESKAATGRRYRAAIAAVSTGDYAVRQEALSAAAVAVIGDISRSLITAAPGHVR